MSERIFTQTNRIPHLQGWTVDVAVWAFDEPHLRDGLEIEIYTPDDSLSVRLSRQAVLDLACQLERWHGGELDFLFRTPSSDGTSDSEREEKYDDGYW